MSKGQALFSGGGSRNTNVSSRALVEFRYEIFFCYRYPEARKHFISYLHCRAGKMSMNSSNLVTPDKRKGMVMVEQGDDQLMHFKWKDRTNGNIEDDLIIFPDDVEFKKVPQCTTGRVFILKFKNSSRKLFFW